MSQEQSINQSSLGMCDRKPAFYFCDDDNDDDDDDDDDGDVDLCTGILCLCTHVGVRVWASLI